MPSQEELDRPRELLGLIKRVKYRNEDFAIFDLLVESAVHEIDAKAVGQTFVCKGKLPGAAIHLRCQVTATLVFDKKFQAWQLALSTGKLLDDSPGGGVISYLAHEAPSVGPERAKKLQAHFQLTDAASLDQLIQTPKAILAQAGGLTIDEADALQCWLRNEGSRLKAKQMLYDIGLTTYQVRIFFEHLGNNAIEKILKDCFILTSVPGVGFITAGKIADKLGVPSNDPGRIRSGVLYALKQACQEGGHTCLDHISLVNASVKLLELHKNPVIDEIKKMLAEQPPLLCTLDQDPRDLSSRKELFEGMKV